MLDHARVSRQRAITHAHSVPAEAGAKDAMLMLLALAVVVVAGLSAWLLLDKPRFGTDDADITMVYARNLAEGHGYVYRPLGERVEGSTSLLWTLVCAAWFMTKPTSFASLFLVTAAFNFVTALGVLKLARRASASVKGVGLTALLLSAAAAFHCWSAGTLMDLSLWSALVTVAFLALVVPPTRRRFWLAGAALIGLVIARPEGFALAPAGVCLHCALSVLRGEPSRSVIRRTSALFAVIVVVIASVTAFRVAYFGYPFPNTYYAKVGADPVYTAVTGLSYVVWFLRTSPFSVLVALAVGYELLRFVAMLVARHRDAHFRAEPMALLRGAIAFELVLGFSLRLIEGADHFAGHRTLQPFVPLGAALVGTSAANLLEQAPAKIGRFATPLLAATFAVLIPVEWGLFAYGPAKSIRGEHGLAKHQREVGATLSALFPEAATRPSLGVVAAGGIAFTYDGPIDDLLGLNWVQMAHGSTDRVGQVGHAAFGANVFWQRPSAIILPEKRQNRPNSACDLYDAWYDDVLHGLIGSARFRLEYRASVVPVDDGFLQFFARRDFNPLEVTAARSAIEHLDWPTGFPEQCRFTPESLLAYDSVPDGSSTRSSD